MAQWYQSFGWRVLQQRWRLRRSEIDLILEQPEQLKFVEVKYRRLRVRPSIYEVAALMRRAKCEAIKRGIATYLQRYPTKNQVTADLVLVWHGDHSSSRAELCRWDLFSL